MKPASSAASFSAISGPMWSRSNPPVASPTAGSGRSSTTSRTRSAVYLFGTTIRPNAASPSIRRLPTAASFSGAWRRHRTSFWKPSDQASLGLHYESLSANNPRLIMCALTPFGQTGPWRDYASSDLLHMAAGGEMASSGYDGADAPNAPPIAPGVGNAWHVGCHFAYMAVMAALVYRTVAGRGQYTDASIHEACALTTEAAVANYIYRGEVLRRQTGRHHAPGPTPRTQFRAKDGTYVCALVAGRLNPKYVRELADLLDGYGVAGDLTDPKYQDPAVIAASTSHIIDDLVANFIASLPAEEVYHSAQARGFTWGAVRTPEALLDDAHLHDRGFWKAVEHPELGRNFVYPGEAAIYNGSPWRISRRAPLIGEHNAEILCDELGLSRSELSILAENRGP